MLEAIRSLPDSGIGYDLGGNRKLKELIAQRALMWNGRLKPEEIITTAGCMDAIAFCLLSLAVRGDTIVVESPVYYGILQLARNLGLNVLELPTNARTGIEIDALKKVLKTRKVKLCLLVSNFNNPLGSCMPDEHKKEVVKLLDHYNIPLIEDDEYGEFHFGTRRPLNCKSFDESGNVIWCGSFSKTLAPGYRVGWVSAGKFHEKISRTKAYHSLASNSLAQEAISRFIENNRYDNHLRKLRRALHANSLQMMRCVSEYFPEGVKVNRPQGGFLTWVEMPGGTDALKLYDKAVRHKISIAPGRLYTLQDQYNNCFKLSYGMPWTEQVENGFKVLGGLMKEVLRGKEI
jgi:DNA-binding transcriptional MocR family regulator